MGKPSGERVIPIIAAIATGQPLWELAVNVMNRGWIAELPSDIAVEVPARIDRQGVQASALPPLPKGIAGLLRNQVAVIDLTAEAVLTQSRSAAQQALWVDPVVHSVRAAEDTLEAILKAQQPYLGYLR